MSANGGLGNAIGPATRGRTLTSAWAALLKLLARISIRVPVKPIRKLSSRANRLVRTQTRQIAKHLRKLRHKRGPVLNWLAAIRRFTLRDVTFIAVTGSCGKTTTIALSQAVLSSVGKCCSGVGSSRWLVAETVLSVGASTKFCFQELHASFPGLIAELLRVLNPQIGIVTVIGGDHYKSYRSLEATAVEKGQLVEHLPESGVAILNADDPHVLSMARRARAKLLTFGVSPEADLRATEVSGIWPNRLSMKVTHHRETVRVETRLVGEHWLASVLAAVATGVVFGVDLNTCAKAIEKVEPVFGRYSVHRRSDDAAYVLDTHKSPFWTIAHGLAFIESARAPRKTIVIGTISDYPGAGGPRYRRVARAALSVTDRVIFVGHKSSHVTKLRQGKIRPKLFAFETSYQAAGFLRDTVVAGELVYVKALNTDHLERLMLSQLEELVCWRERCGKWAPCTHCRNFRKSAPPPFVAG